MDGGNFPSASGFSNLRLGPYNLRDDNYLQNFSFTYNYIDTLDNLKDEIYYNYPPLNFSVNFIGNLNFSSINLFTPPNADGNIPLSLDTNVNLGNLTYTNSNNTNYSNFSFLYPSTYNNTNFYNDYYQGFGLQFTFTYTTVYYNQPGFSSNSLTSRVNTSKLIVNYEDGYPKLKTQGNIEENSKHT